MHSPKAYKDGETKDGDRTRKGLVHRINGVERVACLRFGNPVCTRVTNKAMKGKTLLIRNPGMQENILGFLASSKIFSVQTSVD